MSPRKKKAALGKQHQSPKLPPCDTCGEPAPPVYYDNGKAYCEEHYAAPQSCSACYKPAVVVACVEHAGTLAINARNRETFDELVKRCKSLKETNDSDALVFAQDLGYYITPDRLHNNTVVVKHSDGSHLIFKNAIAVDIGATHFVVLSEHLNVHALVFKGTDDIRYDTMVNNP